MSGNNKQLVRVRQHNGRTFLQLFDPDETLKDLETYVISIVDPRSLVQHRLFWGMLRYVAENSERWDSPDELLLWIKTRFGMYDGVKVGENVVFNFHSISFRDMSARRFKDFMDRSVRLLSEEAGVGDPLAFTREGEKEHDKAN